MIIQTHIQIHTKIVRNSYAKYVSGIVTFAISPHPTPTLTHPSSSDPCLWLSVVTYLI